MNAEQQNLQRLVQQALWRGDVSVPPQAGGVDLNNTFILSLCG